MPRAMFTPARFMAGIQATPEPSFRLDTGLWMQETPFSAMRGPVLLGGPDTVGGNGPGVPDPVPVQDLQGGLAPAFLAGLVLRLGLGDMDVHPQFFLLGVRRHPLPQGDVGGILPVDGGVHQNLAVPRAVPLLGEPALVVTVLAGGRAEVRRGPEVDPPAGEIGADARFQHGLGDVGGVHVHVSDGGHPAGNELGQGQPCAGPDRPPSSLASVGKIHWLCQVCRSHPPP